MYTLRDSEVVTTGCYHASVVSNSTNWPVGLVPAVATGVPIRNHVAQVGVLLRIVGYPFLVRDTNAAVVCLAGAKECLD